MTPDVLVGRRILLGVTGSIAAYKACEIARLLVRAGAEVSVAMTRAATELVGPLTFHNLTGRPVATEMFDADGYFRHLEAARDCELALVAPATANTIAKLAHGLADDLLSTAMLAVTAPVAIAPAMNTRMYLHPAVRANLARLVEYGHRIIDPDEGELACGDLGPGRLAEPTRIVDVVREMLTSASGHTAKGT